MLDESLECILSLWTNERTTLRGEFYQLRDAILWPKPIQKPHPPIIVGGGGKGLLRIAAKYADNVNILPDAGKPGKVSLDNVKKMTDESFRKRIDFVREEAKRRGRDLTAIKFSNFIYNYMITDSKEATRQTAEMMAAGFGMPSGEAMLQSPMSLIGTPDECIAELKRRATSWGVSQFIFATAMGMDEAQARRLYEQVLSHV
jgi:alkanesulfonate monooxygenase SsuD/methylene tetrahydromethanopterin reductase-like flavin-dependent oxidoreductase (luciferase family)